MSLIELQDLQRVMRLPDGSALTVLDGISMSVTAGEHVAIVGRSGSGKSTLLNLIGLLDSPTAGSYHLDGRDTARLGNARRSRLRGETFGFVFQQFNLLPGLTATENVAAPLLYGAGRKFWQRNRLAREMLERVGLGHRMDSMPDRLSGGEQQRVAIARALVRSPRVVLADEPTGALDVETGQSVMDLMESLVHDNNATLLTITHDRGVAARADRQIRLDHGLIVSADPESAEPIGVPAHESYDVPADELPDDTLVASLLGEGEEPPK